MSNNNVVPQDVAAAFRQRLSSGEAVLGCFLSMGSTLASEMMAWAGYEWAIIDLEHGAGGERDVPMQLIALQGTGCLGVVRVEGRERQRVHRVLDYGAHGIMFPRIDTAEQAAEAVAAMRYGPEGMRGVAFSNRACQYGSNFKPYYENSRSLISLIQIESPQAVENVEEIARVEGVDVLFVGPSDLSQSLGMLGDWENPTFLAAMQRVAEAGKKAGKVLGLLLPTPAHFATYYNMGYRMMISGADVVLLNSAARNLVESLRKSRAAAVSST
ncbi:MAG: aldolase/citrate lyase family protein [Bryobacteraceae bacterium]|nr:aldolase/citrate lyase family protein [Bryobacteraceae bacterium]